MVDLGAGRQTVMLENVIYPNTRTASRRENNDNVAVPFRMGNLDFVYTSHTQPKMLNVNNLLSTLYKEEGVEKIVEDVLSPGDLLIFAQESKSTKIKMVETLRIVKENAYKKTPDKKSNTGNAL